MQFLRSTVADYQLRSRISRAIADATSNGKLTLRDAEADVCLQLVPEHPKLMLQYLRERLESNTGTGIYLTILLLDYIINRSSYSFHVMFAAEDPLLERIVALASDRAETDTTRQIRRAARNLVLDFSRMFMDDATFATISGLAARVEKRTGKRLLRSLQVEKTRVRIIDPRPEDIVMISPIRRKGDPESHTDPNHSPLIHMPATLQQQWDCEVCTLRNAINASLCSSCGTKKPALEGVPIFSPTTSHPPGHHNHQGNIHPPPSSAYEGAAPEDAQTAADLPSPSTAQNEADQAEANRVAEAEAEAKRVAEAEAEAKRVAEAEAEAKRVAEAEAEAKRVAEAEAEAKRIAEAEAEGEAEAKRVAEAEAEAAEVPAAASDNVGCDAESASSSAADAVVADAEEETHRHDDSNGEDIESAKRSDPEGIRSEKQQPKPKPKRKGRN